MKKIYTLILLTNFLLLTNSYGQTITNMSNGSTTTCNGLFYDSGGPIEPYSNNEDFVHTFYPATEGAKIKVNFTFFELQFGFGNLVWDFLTVYNGNSVSAPLIGSYTHVNIIPEFISTAEDGSLTFYFHSNPADVFPGWEALVSCVIDCQPPTDLTSDDITCSSAVLSWSSPGYNPGSGYEYYYSTSDIAPDENTEATGSALETFALIENLEQGTTYYYWLRSICLSDAGSDWEFGGEFTTDILIIPTFDSFDPVCSGSEINLPAVSSNEITGIWSPEINNTETTTYTFTPDEGQCAEIAELTIEIIPLPVLTIEENSIDVCYGSEAELFAVSESNVIFWYANEDDEEYLYHGNLFITEELIETTTYWVEAYNISTGCASERIEITVTVNLIPDTPTAVTVQYFEEGETLADLEVEADGDLTWYANEELTIVLPDTTQLAAYTTYYVTQTIGVCESEAVGIFVEPELKITDANGRDLTVYPNPTAGIVKIQSKVAVTNIEVFNISGQVVTSVKAASEVNLTGFTRGTYVLSITLENGDVLTRKVIKK